MQGNPAVIQAIQGALAMEASLQLQYHLDWRLLKNMGMKGSAKKASAMGEDGEDFLKQLTDRLLYFDASAAYASAETIDAPSVQALFQRELKMESDLIEPYEGIVIIAAQAKDDTTRNLFEHLLKWHEGHVDYISRELALIDKLGEATYISSRI
jgi:bacterioferritin